MTSISTKRYYVYTLSYPAPDDRVFYVGQGSGRRMLDHEMEARRGHRCRKCCIIRTIWRDGGEVRRAVVYETDDLAEARRYEQRTISQHRASACNDRSGYKSDGKEYAVSVRYVGPGKWKGSIIVARGPRGGVTYAHATDRTHRAVELKLAQIYDEIIRNLPPSDLPDDPTAEELKAWAIRNNRWYGGE